MFELNAAVVTSGVVAYILVASINHFAVTLPNRRKTVEALKRRLHERLEQALDDVRRYEAKAAQGMGGYTPGGNVAIVKIEFHDWFEGFSTGLQNAVPYAIRDELNLHRYDDLLAKIDPRHDPSGWAQDLKIRANRW